MNRAEYEGHQGRRVFDIVYELAVRERVRVQLTKEHGRTLDRGQDRNLSR